MMWDGFNLRKFPRLPLRCRVTLSSEKSKARYSTATRNVSLGGVCVILGKPLPKMKVCKIILRMNDRQKPIEAVGRIAWSIATKQNFKSKKVYDVGIEILECPSDQLEKLQRFLNSR